METLQWIGIALLILLALLLLFAFAVWVNDRFFQTSNLVRANFPLIGWGRYMAHFLRPFFRQYFSDDNEFTDHLIIQWINRVSEGKSGYFSFDKFDSAHHLHSGKFQMVHSSTPKNEDEMDPQYPILGEQRKHPFQFQSYFYRSAMSLGAIGFEATAAMAAACVDAHAPFNTGEGGFSIHHLPRVKFSYDKKFFKYKKVPKLFKPFYFLIPGKRLKNDFIDLLGSWFCEKGLRDSYLFDLDHFVFYKINWDADLKDFPNYKELDESYGNIIFQVGSNLYGLKKHTEDGSFEFDWDRFKKITSFCRAVEIKLAQGAKQSGGILKAVKNIPVVAEIRGVKPYVDLISPNRFPFYDEGKDEDFIDFCNHLSDQAGGKPVGVKVVISNDDNVEPLIKTMRHTGKQIDFITVDGGDGGSGAAPLSMSILFGKKADEAVPIVDALLKKYQMRDKIKLLASSKLYAPHMSARVMALGADAIGNARSIMIAGGCIRAGHCSGEYGHCPVGLATMKKKNRKAYAQSWDKKVEQIHNYIHAHNHGIIQVASICGVTSPSLLTEKHIAF